MLCNKYLILQWFDGAIMYYLTIENGNKTKLDFVPRYKSPATAWYLLMRSK